MKNILKPRLLSTLLVLGLVVPSSPAFGQYNVGETISQTTRDRQLNFCANGAGRSSLGDMLNPEAGEPTRVLFINFFASY